MGSESTTPSPAPSDPPQVTARRQQRKKPEFTFRRFVSFREAGIELILVPGGRLRRFVVLNSAKLRMTLGQPHRREIDPLHARQDHFHLKTSELWDFAEHEALKFLRELYASLPKRSTDSPVESRIPASRPRLLGQIEPTEPSEETVRGELLFAGATPDGVFRVEILEDGRRIRSVTGLDLARALQVADVELGDMILIERDGSHEISIREQRSGTHGEGHETIRRRRETFKITKERRPDNLSDATPPHRTLRSLSSAS